MMQQPGPVTKNIMILLGLFFIVDMIVISQGNELSSYGRLFSFDSPFFKPFQLVTNIFFTGNLISFLFNLLFLYMFGSFMENIWGSKRFVIFFLSCAVGGGILANCISLFHTIPISNTLSNSTIAEIKGYLLDGGIGTQMKSEDSAINKLFLIYSYPISGPNGGLFALSAAFGLLFPNTEMRLLFLPFGVKAKYLIGVYAFFELKSAISLSAYGGAPWVIVCAALIGVGFIFVWSRNKTNFY